MYDFLVYNASVHYWTVARPLMRKAAYRFTIMSMAKMVAALQEIQESYMHEPKFIVWRIRFLISLANAYDDADEPSNSAQAVVDAVALSKANEGAVDSALRDELNQLQVHIGRHQANADCKKLFDTVVGDLTSVSDKVLFALQKIKSGITQPADIETELTAALDLTKADETAKPGAELELVVEIGRIALSHDLTALAEDCLQRGETQGKNGSQRMRICCDYLKCSVMAKEMKPPGTINPNGKLDMRRMDALRLSRRVEALKVLERALTSCRRLGDPNLLQEGCVLAWNVGIHLVQPHLRKHVHRLFSAAANALEEINSPLTQLRAQFHFEVSKCEVAADFLAKASSQVKKAVQMDYGGMDIQEADGDASVVDNSSEAVAQAKNDVLRPLDKFMRPLKETLQLKSSLYKEPDTAEEQAVLQLEQAKEAKDDMLKQSMLLRAADFLQKAPPTEEHANEPPSPLLKKRIALWVDIVKMAWQSKMIHLVQRGAAIINPETDPTQWDPKENREVVVKQAEIHFHLAESYIEEMKQASTKAENTDTGLDARTLGVVAPGLEPRLARLKESIISEFMAALKLGLLTQQDWIVENATVFIWNYHVPGIWNSGVSAVSEDEDEDEIAGEDGDGKKQKKDAPKERHLHLMMPQLATALEETYNALQQISTKNTALICSMSEVIALYFSVTDKHEDASRILTDFFESPNSIVVKAEEQFQPSPFQLKEVTMLRARLEKIKGTPSPAIIDKMLHTPGKVFTILQILTTDDVVIEDTEKITLVKDAIAKLAEMPPCAPTDDTTLEKDEEEMEMHAELWTRLAQVALALNQKLKADEKFTEAKEILQNAQDAAQKAVEPLPQTAKDRAAVPSRVWRWYSLADCLCGQSIAAMLVAGGQEKALQDKLTVAALQRICLGAQWGVRGKLPELVVEAALHFWKIATPMMSTAMARKLLFKHLKAILSELAAIGERTRFDLRLALYEVFFQCFTDEEAWEEGLAAVDEAFLYIPASDQKTLWQAKVIFMSKLGRSVQEGLSKMKSKDDAVLQAKVWSSLARASADPGAQISAYSKAVEVMEGKFQQLDFLIELGEWFYTNRLPRQDAEEQLQAAADMLLDVEQAGVEDDGDDDEEDDGMSAAPSRTSRTSGRSRQSNRSRVSGAPSGARSRTPGSVAGSAAGGKSKSVRSGAGSRMTKQSAKSGTMSVIGSEGGGGGISDYPSVLNVGHFERLVRVYTMLAKVAPDHSARTDRCLVAHHYLIQMWECALKTANTTAVKATAAKADKDEGLETLTEEEKPFWEEYNALSDEEKAATDFEAFLQTRYFKHHVPESMSGWASFEVSDELHHHIQHPAPFMEDMTINSGTIPKPPLTTHYLEYLASTLCSLGYHLHAIPALILVDVIAADVIKPKHKPLQSYARLRVAETLDIVNMGQQSTKWREWAGRLGLTTEDAKEYAEEVEAREQHASSSKKKTNRVNAAEGPIVRKQLDSEELPVREIWTRLARCTINLGQYRATRELLLGCKRHNSAFDDAENTAACLLIESELDELEGKAPEAVIKAIEAQGMIDSSVDGWSSSTTQLLQQLKTAGRLTEAKDLLERAVRAFDSTAQITCNPAIPSDSPEEDPEFDPDAVHAVATFKQELAAIAVQEVLDQQQAGNPWEQTWDHALALLRESTVGFESLESHLDLVGLNLKYVECLFAVERGETVPAHCLSEALRLLEEAETHAAFVVANAHEPELSTGISLPCERELAKVKSALGHLHLIMAAQDADAAGVALKEEQEKGSDPVAKWLEATAPNELPTAQQLLVPHVERALVYFSGAYSQVQHVDQLCPTARGQVGHCLRMLAGKTGQLASVWVAPVGMLRSISESSSNRSAGSSKGGRPASRAKGAKSPSVEEPSPQIDFDALEEEQNSSQSVDVVDAPVPGGTDYRKQAIQALDDTVTQAMAQGQWEAAGLAAHELLACYGWVDIQEAIKYLCLFQSCMAQKELSGILRSAYAPTNREQLFLRQRDCLLKTHLNPSICEQLQASERFLQASSEAARRLKCSAGYEEMCGVLPPNACILVLQHSPDGRSIYAGILAADPSMRAVGRISLLPEDRAELQAILKALQAFRTSLSKLLITYCDDAGKGGDVKPVSGNQGDDADKSDPELDSIIQRMEALFAPLLSTAPKLSFEDTPTDSTNLAFTLALSKLGDQNVVILPDSKLASLPLEALSSLSTAQSVSRDFSLNMLHHRMTASDAAVKDSKFAYVVDPRAEDSAYTCPEDSERDRTSTLDVFEGMVANKFVAGWEGVTGTEYIPSDSKWQALLRARESGGFLYHGMGRCLSYMAPSLLAGMSLSGCNVVILADRAENDASNRRQSKIDNQKSAAVLALEKPYETAALFSLAGVNTIVLNQWANSLHANASLVTNVLTEVKKGQPFGPALQTAVRPRPDPENPEEKQLKSRVRFNSVLYGVPHVALSK
jgi:tetratricopeptide (TPR) repeat protein